MMATNITSSSKPIYEWTNTDVSHFLSSLSNIHKATIVKLTEKHMITGVDLLDLTEADLVELGFSLMHEKKHALRSI